MLFISIVAVLVVIATILIRKSKKEDIIAHYEPSHIEELAPETTPTIVPVVEEVVEVKKPEAKKPQNKKPQPKANNKKTNKK